MTATILDGKAIAKEIRDEVAADVAHFVKSGGDPPRLAAVIVGDDPASHVYVGAKERACGKCGIESEVHRLPADTTQEALIALVSKLNNDANVNGILVQLPLPDHICQTAVLDAVDPGKDVDCFHPHNVGLLSQGRPQFLPCTPAGIQQLFHRTGVNTQGKHAVVVGRSDIVGKPIAMMLAQKDSPSGPNAANSTVTICHSRTADLPAVVRQADIVVAAIGKPNFITDDMVKPGAVVVDVGINRVDKKLVGDVDFHAVREVAGAVTPVPGGVGPLTIAMLLHNTLTAAKRQRNE